VKRIMQYLGTVFLVLIMVMAAFVLITPRFGWRIDTAVSNSMLPTLKAGDIVITQPIDPTSIKVGDIITYGSPIDGKVVTHRVVEIRGHSRLLFQTKGDANEDPDPYAVPPENIVGKVWFHIPLFGYVAQFLKRPLVLLLCVTIPGLIIIILETRNIWHVLSNERIERQHRIG